MTRISGRAGRGVLAPRERRAGADQLEASGAGNPGLKTRAAGRPGRCDSQEKRRYS